MRPAMLVLALALLPPVLRSQQPATTTAPPGTIEGTVVNGLTGEALKKASVTVRRVLTPTEARLMRLRGMGMDNTHSTATDTTGRFVFSGLQPGDYNLWANRPGFVAGGYRRRGRGAYEQVRVTPGETVNDIHFKLMPGAVISGKVVDEDGDPVIGAMVQALRYNWINGERQLSMFGSGNTNDLGEYRIFDLMPGKYYVRASYQTQAEAADEVYAPVYYPQGRDPSAAVAIDLKAADEADGTDLALLPVHAVRIRGQLIPPGGSGQEGGFNVMLMPRGEMMNPGIFHPTQVGADGRFEISSVAPGTYVLYAMWFPRDGRRGVRAYDRSEQFTGRAVLEVSDADVDGVTLAVGPGTSITGQIETAPGALLPSGLHVALQEREPLMGELWAPVGSGGGFVFQVVSDGVYRARLTGSLGQNGYLKSATLGGQDVLDSSVTISQDNPPGMLLLVLDPHGGGVEGTVMNDEKPYGGATVVLIPDPPHRNQDRLYRAVYTDNSGRFAMGGLPPGDYKVFAWDQVDDSAYMDAAFLAPYESRGVEVHLDPDGQANVQTELITTSENSQ